MTPEAPDTPAPTETPAPPELISQAAAVAHESGESPLREGQMREPGLILGYVRALRRRKGTQEERDAERFVRHSIRRAFAEWQRAQPTFAQARADPRRAPAGPTGGVGAGARVAGAAHA